MTPEPKLAARTVNRGSHPQWLIPTARGTGLPEPHKRSVMELGTPSRRWLPPSALLARPPSPPGSVSFRLILASHAGLHRSARRPSRAGVVLSAMCLRDRSHNANVHKYHHAAALPASKADSRRWTDEQQQSEIKNSLLLLTELKHYRNSSVLPSGVLQTQGAAAMRSDGMSSTRKAG